jgi:hypothetical protein
VYRKPLDQIKPVLTFFHEIIPSPQASKPEGALTEHSQISVKSEQKFFVALPAFDIHTFFISTVHYSIGKAKARIR